MQKNPYNRRLFILSILREDAIKFHTLEDLEEYPPKLVKRSVSAFYSLLHSQPKDDYRLVGKYGLNESQAIKKPLLNSGFFIA